MAFFDKLKTRSALCREVLKGLLELLIRLARIHSFTIIGVLSVVQMTIWKIVKDQKIPHASLVFYIEYIVLFIFLMINIKKRELKMNL